MSVAADKLKPLDYVKVHGLAEKPVVCIVTTDGNYIAISTSKPLSFLNADKRLVAQNLGALSSLIDSAPQVYQDLLVAGTKKTQTGSDSLLFARAFDYIKSNYDIAQVAILEDYEFVLDESIAAAIELQVQVEKAHLVLVNMLNKVK